MRTEAAKALAIGLRPCRERVSVLMTIALLLTVGTLATIEVQRWIAGDSSVGTQILAGLIIFVSALTGSIAGFAFSAFAGGGLAHFFADPVQSVQVLALCSLAIQVYSVASIWRSIQWRRLVPFVAGGVVTAPLAVQWLTKVSLPAFGAGLGAFLVVYGLYMLIRRPQPPVKGNVGVEIALGALGGITGGLAAFPGAFVAPWCSLRDYDKHAARGICQTYILMMQILVLACMHSHNVAPHLSIALGLYIALALLAAHLGITVFRALTNRQFCLVVHGLLIVSGLSLTAHML